MIAIIKTGSKQYKVKEKDLLKIEKIEGELGSEIIFDNVLLISDDAKNEVQIGMPNLDKKVIGKIKAQGKAKKIDVIKFKNKTRYTRKYGHRQPYTEVEIISIGT